MNKIFNRSSDALRGTIFQREIVAHVIAVEILIQILSFVGTKGFAPV